MKFLASKVFFDIVTQQKFTKLSKYLKMFKPEKSQLMKLTNESRVLIKRCCNSSISWQRENKLIRRRNFIEPVDSKLRHFYIVWVNEEQNVYLFSFLSVLRLVFEILIYQIGWEINVFFLHRLNSTPAHIVEKTKFVRIKQKDLEKKIFYCGDTFQ